MREKREIWRMQVSCDSTASINSAISETKVIELVGWKVGYHGMHAILCVQHGGGNDCGE